MCESPTDSAMPTIHDTEKIYRKSLLIHLEASQPPFLLFTQFQVSFQSCLPWDCLTAILNHGNSEIVHSGIPKHIPVPHMQSIQSFIDHHIDVTCNSQKLLLWREILETEIASFRSNV